MRIPSAVLPLLACGLLGQGCTILKIPADPPSEEVRAQLGRIRIDVVPQEPEPDISHPPAGCCEGFCRGMAHGAEVVLPKGAEGMPGGAAVIFFVPMPFTAMVFGFITMFRSMPSEELDRLEAPVRDAFQETRISHGLDARLVKAVRERSAGSILGPEDVGPADTVMRVEIDQKLLYQRPRRTQKMKEFLDPEFAVYVRAHVRLIRASDAQVVYEALFKSESSGRPFAEWSRNAGDVRDALDGARGQLAWEVAATIFRSR